MYNFKEVKSFSDLSSGDIIRYECNQHVIVAKIDYVFTETPARPFELECISECSNDGKDFWYSEFESNPVLAYTTVEFDFDSWLSLRQSAQCDLQRQMDQIQSQINQYIRLP